MILILIFFLPDYKETVKAGQAASDPLSGSIPMTFANNQKDNATILMGRPFEYTGPPIVLYHNVFDQFLQDSTNQNLVITAACYRETETFLFEASEFYKGEPERRVVTVGRLSKLIDEHVDQLQYGNGCAADGALASRVGDSIAYQMMWELKNEMISGNSEPVLQASLYYHGYWSQNDVCMFLISSKFD